MNREDWNRRALHLRVARKALQQLAAPGSVTAFAPIGSELFTDQTKLMDCAWRWTNPNGC